MERSVKSRRGGWRGGHKVRGFIEFYNEHDAEQFVAEGNGKELLGKTVELFAQGRQVLRPEHGPAGEPRCSPRQHQRQGSSTSLSNRSHRQCSRSRSRSCSPLSSRRHGYNSSSDSMRLVYRAVHPARHDEHQSRANVDRHVSPREPCPPRSPRRAHSNDMDENHEAARVPEYKLSTAYPASGDYLDSYDDRHAQLERMWQEYGYIPATAPIYR